MSAKAPDAADAVIGRNIRLQRLSNGMSLSELGRQLGVTFQQVQKYESGSNRVAGGRLVRIAGVLDVPLMTLFDGVKGLDRRPTAHSALELMAGRHAFRLALAFSQIDDLRCPPRGGQAGRDRRSAAASLAWRRQVKLPSAAPVVSERHP